MSAIQLPNSSRLLKASYVPHKLPMYSGNPLVEALPPELSDEKVIEYMQYMPRIDSKYVDEYSLEEKRLCVDLLKDAYIVPPVALDLYTRIRRLLFQGYRFRNPFDVETQQSLFNLDKPDQRQSRPWNQTTIPSLLYMAPSGKGKTTVIKNILQLFPDVIEHTSYDDRNFYLRQPLFLMVDCPSNGSKRTLVERIISEIDRLLGTDHYQEAIRKKLNTSKLIEHAQKLCAEHYVGMIIIDELQNLRMDTAKAGNAENDVATLTFLDEFLNDIGVPVLLIGTWRCARLLTQRLETVRRAGNDGRINESPFKIDDDYWNDFISKLWDYQVLPKRAKLTESIKKNIHFASGGLPALASQLLIAAQQLALDLQCASVDLKILEAVYNRDFLPMHNALNQLRSGNYGTYEDLQSPKETLAGSDRFSGTGLNQ